MRIIGETVDEYRVKCPCKRTEIRAHKSDKVVTCHRCKNTKSIAYLLMRRQTEREAAEMAAYEVNGKKTGKDT